VFKRIGVLSGGERNRYALARMLLHPSNFLLLDEPTNHLDIRAKDVLLESLQQFNGTVVFVSHDRYFIDKLATRVFEIGGGEVRVFPGNYEDYLWRKEGKPLDLSLNGAGPEPLPEPEPVAAHANSVDKSAKRVNPLKLKQMKDRCQQIERQIATTESEIASYEKQLSDFVSAEQTMRTAEMLDQRRGDLEKLMAEWELLSSEVEEVS
jgi:ATP-binding cassette subfamily F protein 3